jgi:Flp pilus assembly CpaE family ATPase
MNLPDRRAHQRSDENNVAAPGAARQPHEFSNLTDIGPMVRVTLDRGPLGRAVQRNESNLPSARNDQIGHGQRQ